MQIQVSFGQSVVERIRLPIAAKSQIGSFDFCRSEYMVETVKTGALAVYAVHFPNKAFRQRVKLGFVF